MTNLNIDLKNINLSKYSKNIVNIGIIIVALIISNAIYKNNGKAAAILRNQMDAEQRKNIVLGEISQLENTVNSYRAIFSRGDSSVIISKISGIASELNIKIVSITPQPEKKYPTYVRYPFIMNISTNSYHNVGKFLSQLENYKDAYLIIDDVNMRSEEVGRFEVYEGGEAPEEGSFRVVLDLQISIITFEG